MTGRLEQLIYGYGAGLEQSPGAQIKAVSPGLSNLTLLSVHWARQLCIGYHPPVCRPQAPVSFGWVDIDGLRYVFCRGVSSGRAGRGGTIAGHVVVGPPAAIDPAVVGGWYGSPFWRLNNPDASDALPVVTAADISPADITARPTRVDDTTVSGFCQALLAAREHGRRLAVVAPPEIVAALYTAAGRLLGGAVLGDRSLSTFETSEPVDPRIGFAVVGMDTHRTAPADMALFDPDDPAAPGVAGELVDEIRRADDPFRRAVGAIMAAEHNLRGVLGAVDQLRAIPATGDTGALGRLVEVPAVLAEVVRHDAGREDLADRIAAGNQKLAAVLHHLDACPDLVAALEASIEERRRRAASRPASAPAAHPAAETVWWERPRLLRRFGRAVWKAGRELAEHVVFCEHDDGQFRGFVDSYRTIVGERLHHCSCGTTGLCLHTAALMWVVTDPTRTRQWRDDLTGRLEELSAEALMAVAGKSPARAAALAELVDAAAPAHRPGRAGRGLRLPWRSP